MRAEGQTYIKTLAPLQTGPSRDQGLLMEKLRLQLLSSPEGRVSDSSARVARLYERLARGNYIGTRTSCLENFLGDEGDGRLFGAPGFPAPTLAERMRVYAETAEGLARQAFPADHERPDGIVLVSCTGYESPNAVQKLTALRGWGSDVRLLNIGHMGCYASIPVLRLAGDIVRSQESDFKLSLFFIELCTLHMSFAEMTSDQAVIQSLFADGAIRVEVARDPGDADESRLVLVDSFETIVPETSECMSWRLSEHGFAMSLSRQVPDLIREVLPGTVQRFLAKNGLFRADIGVWAVHPGGPRIIEDIARCLEIPENATRHSRDVLFRRGNMSSATLPHIWAEIMADDMVLNGDLICSLAFGPGLTVAVNLLRKEC